MNEERKVEYVIQYEGMSGRWYDGHRFKNDMEAFEYAKQPMRMVFPYAPHRIVERVITEAVLLNIDPIEET